MYLRFEDRILIDENIQAFRAYTRHPDAHPAQKHLVDLSGVTAIEWDYVKLMQLQALKAGFFCGRGSQTLKVYYCPTKLSLSVAKMILRSWVGINSVIPIIQQHEDDALSVLGLRQGCFSNLLADHG
ncbi:hypothetical protein [Salipiger bermudensis]|uniref:hypothetical protein n=1 Tax=Salipiger bermudensis TaxID=344736 RepID=UPI001CD31343|nr:hypothetical protein [Salipiger bermudensis]MCA0960757.1 hypothetical protein [Salipiger bermudensis]